MSKVLYVAPYRDLSSLGVSAMHSILALDSQGVDVIPRPIFTGSQPNQEIPSRIKELERKSDKKAQICVQQVPMEYLSYNGRFDMNVAILNMNHWYLNPRGYIRNLKYFDKIGVNDRLSKLTLSNELVKDVFTIRTPVNRTRYDNLPDPLPIPGLNDKFIFYFVGKIKKRKNIAALIRAFHSEFHPSEPVELMFKTWLPLAPHQTSMEVQSLCQSIKQFIGPRKMEKYKQEIVCPEFFDTTHEVLRVHQTGHCFVLPSYGDCWNQNVLDALWLNKTIISNDTFGLYHFAPSPIKSSKVQAINSQIPHDESYSGNEAWMEIDELSLRKSMRQAFEGKLNILNHKCLHSYESVGVKLKQVLGV